MGIIKLTNQSQMAEEQSKSQHTPKYKGFLKGHGGWVTTLAVGEEQFGEEKVEFLLSGSRDKTLIKWELDMKKDEEEDRNGADQRRCSLATLTSSLKLNLPETLASASLPLGMALLDYGTLPLEELSASSLDTRRMFSQLHFLLMIDRSSLEVSTRKSRSGTPVLNLSIPSTRASTRMPFHALDSTMPRSQPSVSLPPGTRPSRFGITST